MPDKPRTPTRSFPSSPGLRIAGPRLADRLVMRAAKAFLEARPFAWP